MVDWLSNADAIDGIIRLVLAFTAAWFVLATLWLWRLQQGKNQAAPTTVSTRVHLAWLAIPLLAVPSGAFLQSEQPETLPTNLADGGVIPAVQDEVESVKPVDDPARVNHPSPIVAVSHPVHPI